MKDYKKILKSYNLGHLIPQGLLDYYEAIDILTERAKQKISSSEALDIDDCLDEIRG